MSERASEKDESVAASESEMSGEADLRDTEVAGPKPAVTLKSSAVNEGVMSARGLPSPRPDSMAVQEV